MVLDISHSLFANSECILEDMQISSDIRARFLLSLGNLLIGVLTVENRSWQFVYSDEFKQNDSLRPIITSPDINKVCESRELWQLFACRIPSVRRFEIRDILKRENISEVDIVGLLKRFGRRTISNPFQLEIIQ